MNNQNSAQKNVKRVFHCYSPKLRKFLDQNGTHWIGKGVNSSNNKTYWLFEQSTRLGTLLVKYKEECSLRDNQNM